MKKDRKLLDKCVNEIKKIIRFLKEQYNKKKGHEKILFKHKKVSIVKLGIRKKVALSLWALLISSFSFAVYKNFTAIDTHTVYETNTVEKQLLNTSGIQTFVENFAIEFFTWGESQDSLEERNQAVSQYLTTELQRLNEEMVSLDTSTRSKVRDVQFWNVTEIDENNFEAIFSVVQQITEDEEERELETTFNVRVHVDELGDMVITRNPTTTARPQKSTYNPDSLDSDGTMDGKTMQEIREFLETFFKLYPTATERELAQFVSQNALKAINQNYVFSDLINPIYKMDGDDVYVFVSVRYLCQETKTTKIEQFELTLRQNDHSWVIITG